MKIHSMRPSGCYVTVHVIRTSLRSSKFLKDGFEIAFLLVSEAYFISCADQNIKKVTIYYV